MIRRASVPLATLVLAGCATAPPRPVTLAPARPLVMLAPPPPILSWLDADLTPGRWRYERSAGESSARFGTGAFALRCVLAERRILVERAGAAAMTLTTTYGVRTLAAAAGVAQLRANDPLLDQLAFSRGRFMVEAPGAARLIVPAWAEPARVVEDCRTAPGPAS